MERQIHEDVDAIFPDLIDGLRIGQPRDVTPLVGVLLEFLRQRILAKRVGITEYFQLLVIVLAKQGQQIASDGVFPEIRRHVTNTQPATRVSAVAVRLNGFPETTCVPLVPAAQLRADHLGVVAGMIVKCEDQIAVNIGKIGLQPNAMSIRINCFVKPSRLHQGVAEIDVNFRIFGLKANRFTIRRCRLIQLAHFPQSVTEVAMRFGKIRLDLNGPLEQCHGRVGPADLSRHHSEQMQGLEVIWLATEDFAIDFLRFPHAAGPVEVNRALERWFDLVIRWLHSALFSLNLAVQT